MDPEQQVLTIEFANTGMNTLIDPKRIPVGTFQFLENCISEQEGSITTRRGRKVLGTEPGTVPHTYVKLVVASGEVRLTPSINYRYIGDLGNIYRTQTFAAGTFTTVNGDGYGNSAAVCTTPTTSVLSPLWHGATFNSGILGVNIEFFATQNFMLKDNSNALAGTNGLQKWGILPAYGVPHGAGLRVYNATNASPIVITTNFAYVSISDHTPVGISGVSGTTSANTPAGVTWFAKVTGFTSTTFAIYQDAALTVPVAGNGNFNLNTVGFVANFGLGNSSLPQQSRAPNGGATGSPATSISYKYVYTYGNSKTGSQGNPSQIMRDDSNISDATIFTGAPIPVYLNVIQISGIFGTDDPQVDVINLFRAGGTLTDGIYRKVATFANPGLGNTVAAFNDLSADITIANFQFVSFFNDPPVPSTASQPFRSTFASGSGNGRVPLTTSSPFYAFGGAYGATRGSIIHIIGGEDCVVEVITSATVATVYLQKSYNTGQVIECDVVANQPCTLVVQAFNSMFVAGDPHNPHILYKSATGLPESFPVVDATGAILQQTISNPGNPIQAITEFRGTILCLCAQNIYEVSVFNGVMMTANLTPALRGLVTSNAWCRVENEIWYLGYDGIWSWDGSTSQKRSVAIDSFFHTFLLPASSSSINPIDYTPAVVQYTRMEYYRHSVRIVYNDVLGNNAELLYEMNFDRWSRNKKLSPGSSFAERVLFNEIDTGNLIYIRDNGVVCVDDANDNNNNTTDEYTTVATNGSVITATATTGWIDCGDEYTNKVFDEILLDIDPVTNSGGNAVTFSVFTEYVFSVPPIAQYTIAGSASSARQWLSIPLNQQTDAGGLSNFGIEGKVIAFGFSLLGGPLRPIIYGMKIRWRPVGQITEGLAYDWNNLGYPWDKRLSEFTVEFDTRSTARTLIMDTVNGINGTSVNTHVATFTINNPITTGPGRGLTAFPIPDGTIAKLVRLRAYTSAPTSATAGSSFFKLLNVDFQYNKFPPDIVQFTEPNDFGYECEKVARNVKVKMDTGGVNCATYLMGDGVILNSFTVNTTLDDWERILPVTTNPDVIARLYKLLNSAGGGGKAQLFDWSMDFVREPCAVRIYDTFELDFGFSGWKYIYQGWFDYFSTANISMTITTDTGATFFTATLPSHTTFRDSARIYFPVVSGSVFNKAQIYRFKFTSSQVFKLYGMTIDWMPWNADQRTSFQQYTTSYPDGQENLK